MKQGRIVKGIAGFYYVYTTEGELYACKAKGLFRKLGIKPLPGDLAEIEITDEKDMEGNVVRLLPRRSELLRPAVANVDQALVIFALCSPAPNLGLLDRFLLRMRVVELPTVICFNKTDLAEDGETDRIAAIYENAGCRLLFLSAKTGEGVEDLRSLLRGRTTTVAGPSGVGKSTIVNALQSTVWMETGAISVHTERGRHTTRHSELIPLGDDSFIMDTPGFSSLLLPEIGKEELASLYPELQPYAPECRFQGCAHIAEPDCAVKQALAEGKVATERYESYRMFYEELKERKAYR